MEWRPGGTRPSFASTSSIRGTRRPSPRYIKAFPTITRREGKSEDKPTSFPDWSHRELKDSRSSSTRSWRARYDDDPRLAFVETGFGLWAEYHIYSGPMKLGKTFPDKSFQAAVRSPSRPGLPEYALDDLGRRSRRVADAVRSQRELLKIPFGVFDDSFLVPAARAKRTSRTGTSSAATDGSRAGWRRNQLLHRPRSEAGAGGHDGPHGISFEKAAADFHITFMIANDQPKYQPMDRIRAAGLACGYKFRSWHSRPAHGVCRVTVTNTG